MPLPLHQDSVAPFGILADIEVECVGAGLDFALSAQIDLCRCNNYQSVIELLGSFDRDVVLANKRAFSSGENQFVITARIRESKRLSAAALGLELYRNSGPGLAVFGNVP